jgi:hypothetical protein
MNTPQQGPSAFRIRASALRGPKYRVLDVRQIEQSATADIHELVGRRRTVEVVGATRRFTNEKE